MTGNDFGACCSEIMHFVPKPFVHLYVPLVARICWCLAGNEEGSVHERGPLSASPNPTRTSNKITILSIFCPRCYATYRRQWCGPSCLHTAPLRTTRVQQRRVVVRQWAAWPHSTHRRFLRNVVDILASCRWGRREKFQVGHMLKNECQKQVL